MPSHSPPYSVVYSQCECDIWPDSYWSGKLRQIINMNKPKSANKRRILKSELNFRLRALTATVKIKLHKGDRAMYPVVERIFFTEGADPCKVGRRKVLLKERLTMLHHGRRVVGVEGEEEGNDLLALAVGEQ